MADSPDFDPTSVDLTSVDPVDVICYLNAGGNDYDGRLGARISALFVILVVSSATTVFPVLATRVRWLRIPLYVYLFARYFGAGVIIATAFIHLLDPAYGEIGPNTCVGMTGNWANYTWPPSIAMTAVMLIFLLDFAAEWYVETKYAFAHAHADVEGAVTTNAAAALKQDEDNASDGPKRETSADGDQIAPRSADNHHHHHHHSHQFLHSADQQQALPQSAPSSSTQGNKDLEAADHPAAIERAFRQQIAAFLILEFGVIFHSVIIGLNLGVVGDEFSTLYPVLVFHQSFEGLGIGARLSAIPFPPRYRWLPWALCAAYGLTTPIAIAIGLGVRTTYDSGSFTANVVSGVLDSVSAGILLYTGLVELLARDFLFNPERSRDKVRVLFMLACLFLGTGVMALLGKWA